MDHIEQKVTGNNWDAKIKNAVLGIVKQFDGDVFAALHHIVDNLMVRDLILDVVFEVSNEDKIKLFKKFRDNIDRMDSETVVKHMSDYK